MHADKGSFAEGKKTATWVIPATAEVMNIEVTFR